MVKGFLSLIFRQIFKIFGVIFLGNPWLKVLRVNDKLMLEVYNTKYTNQRSAELNIKNDTLENSSQ